MEGEKPGKQEEGEGNVDVDWMIVDGGSDGQMLSGGFIGEKMVGRKRDVVY